MNDKKLTFFAAACERRDLALHIHADFSQEHVM